MGINNLKRLQVPKEMLSFFDGKIIKNLGNRINDKGYYEFDNFIFKINDKNEIENTYYRIQYLIDNPNILP